MDGAFWAVVAFGGFVSALVGAILGAGKRRAVDGLLCGLFLGPIGWLMILLSPTRHARRCPYCREGIALKAVKCPHCQSNLREELPAGEDEWPPPRRQARKF